jgi:hypothetical protein
LPNQATYSSLLSSIIAQPSTSPDPYTALYSIVPKKQAMSKKKNENEAPTLESVIPQWVHKVLSISPTCPLTFDTSGKASSIDTTSQLSPPLNLHLSSVTSPENLNPAQPRSSTLIAPKGKRVKTTEQMEAISQKKNQKAKVKAQAGTSTPCLSNRNRNDKHLREMFCIYLRVEFSLHFSLKVIVHYDRINKLVKCNYNHYYFIIFSLVFIFLLYLIDYNAKDPIPFEELYSKWRESKSFIRFDHHVCRFVMVDKSAEGAIIESDMMFHDYNVGWSNKNLWNNKFTSREVRDFGTKFKETLWQVEMIKERVVDVNKKTVSYWLQWKGLNGRDFIQ